MFVFGSYSSQEQAERALGFEWRYSWPLGVQDGEALVVFADSTHVVAAFDTMRKPADLLRIARPTAYPRDSVRFRIVRDSSGAGPTFALTLPPEPAV
jgi:hypothetical protein